MSKPVITPDDKLKRFARTIRPYRHAIIRLIKPTAGTLSYEIIENEFGDNLVKSVGDGTGNYEVELNTGLFFNIDNVVQETDIIHSSVTIPPILTSVFNSSSKDYVIITVYDISTALTIDIEGEIILTIKEFYA